MKQEGPNSGFKKSTVVIAGLSIFVLTTLVVGATVYFWRESVNDDTRVTLNKRIASLEEDIINLKSTTTEDKATSKTIQKDSTEEEDWVKYSGKGFYKFSINVPKDAYVCIGDTATGGNDFGCWPEGVYLNDMEDFPYGIAFEQTTLEPKLEELVKTFNYEGYVDSDINFDDADNQIMVKGEETKTFYDKDNNSVTKDIAYTKYLFTKDSYVYMPVIYTDKNLSDYELYQQILMTWQFD